MNKNLKIGLGILLSLLMVGGGIILASRDSAKEDAIEPTSQNEEAEKTPELSPKAEPEQQPVTSSSGKYLDYSDQAFSEASNDTRLLFFHAAWCPQCLKLEKSIKNSDIPSGVTIFEVDFDRSQDLRKRYGVTVQTTVVKVGLNGENEGRFVAYDEPNFESVKRELLTQ